MVTLVNAAEMEEVGENIILKYLGRRKYPPRCIDIEGFIQDFLHLCIEYAVIADQDFDKVGFLSDGEYPLGIMESGKKVLRVYPKGTIVIDRSLLKDDQSGRKRFTLAHEAAHVIYERMTPLVPGPWFKRCYDKERAYDLAEMRERFNLGETQVDRLGSILIMPRFLMEQTLRDYRFSLVLPVYGDNVLRSRDKILLQKMADAVGASYSAFFNRLKELNMIERHTIDEYLELEMNFEGGLTQCSKRVYGHTGKGRWRQR